ncbi:uncharacterized protein FYW47_018487 [Aplochiton taeniatus]
MDDKLILSVFNFPELYNVTQPNYRSTDSRTNAWKNISTLVGLPAEECKRKWKNLRDRYLKEVRQEIKSKQQGEPSPSRWKCRHLLNFLAPFTGSRNGTDNDHNDDAENPDNESADAEDENKFSNSHKIVQTNRTTTTQDGSMQQVALATQLSPVSPATQMSQLAFLTKLPPGEQIASVPKSKDKALRRKRCLMSESPASTVPTNIPLPAKMKKQVNKNGSLLPNRSRDEDELFLLSFVPALKRLAPQKRCETKMRIHQIMYEAEFNQVPLKAKEEQTET